MPLVIKTRKPPKTPTKQQIGKNGSAASEDIVRGENISPGSNSDDLFDVLEEELET